MSFETSLLGQLREEIHRRLAPRRLTVLLVAIIAAFLVRPLIGDSGAGPILFSITMLVLLLLALYNINVDELVGDREALLAQRRRRSIKNSAHHSAFGTTFERALQGRSNRSTSASSGAANFRRDSSVIFAPSPSASATPLKLSLPRET